MASWTNLGIAAGAAALAAGVIATIATSARGSAHAGDEPPKARPTLIAERTGWVPGKVNWVGVHFEMDAGWHIYWNGRNDTGFAPKLAWTLPQGWTTGATVWPAPARKVAPGDILDHIYEGEVTLLVPVHVPAAVKPGEKHELRLQAEWLVCDEACIPEEKALSIALPVDAAAGEASASKARLTAAWARVPQEASKAVRTSADGFSVRWSDPDLARATITIKGATALRFYPAEACSALKDPIAQGEGAGEQLVIDLVPDAITPTGPRTAERVRLLGVLEVERAGGAKEWYDVGPIAATPEGSGR